MLTPSVAAVFGALLLVLLCQATDGFLSSRRAQAAQRSGDGSSPQCDICLQVTSTVGPLVSRGVGLDLATSMLFADCLYTSYGDSCTTADACFMTCSGFIHEYGSLIVARIVNDTLAPASICAAVQLCPPPGPPPPPSTDVPVPSDLGDSTGQPTWPMWQLTEGVGLIAHVSDMHVDHLYKAGSRVDCALELCCREEWGMGTDATNSAGVWGEYNCDTPELTTHSMLDYINRTLNPRPDVIIYTGDDPAHDIWEQSRDNQLSAISYTSAMLHAYFPDIPIFSALGNHEAFPSDQYGGPTVDGWLYSQLPLLWAPDLCDDAKKTLAYAGYYQTLVRPGLRVISLNSNIYATSDLYVDPANPVDVSYQLNWLADVLRQLEERQEKAIIIAHMPPSSWYPVFSARFNDLLTRYQKSVVNLFYGHTHHSEVQLYTDSSTSPPTPHTVGYIGGSVTPFTQTNPGFQAYTYNRADVNDSTVTSLVTDYTVYWIDLPDANAQQHADWQPHFRAKRDAAVTSLMPTDWFALAERIKKGDAPDAFRKLYVAFRRGYYNDTTGVDPKDWGCQMESDSDAKYEECYKRMGLRAPQRQLGGDCDAPSKDEREQIMRKVAVIRADNARQRAVAKAAAVAATR